MTARPRSRLSTPGPRAGGLSQSVARADAAPQLRHKSMHWGEKVRAGAKSSAATRD